MKNQKNKILCSNVFGWPSVVFFLFSVFCFLSSGSPSAFACPLCKEALAKIGEVWTSLGFNWSIYFMIAMPFLLVAGFAGALYLNYRRHSSRRSDL